MSCESTPWATDFFRIIEDVCIKVPLASADKHSAIRELMDLVCEGGGITDCDDALKAVLEREALMSTEIGHGVAVPHGKADSVTHLTGALGITSEPIEFDSVDGKPVRLIILMVSPASETGPHIKALAHISKLFSNESFRERLIDAETADEVIGIIQAEEERAR